MAKVLTILSITMLPKQYETHLTYGLSHAEFRCRCGRPSCHFTLVAKSLILSYKGVRYDYGTPLKINSGFRCQKHNKNVGGLDESSHTTGHAIDISTKGLDGQAKDDLIDFAKRRFDVVLVYKYFIHCHNEAKQDE